MQTESVDKAYSLTLEAMFFATVEINHPGVIPVFDERDEPEPGTLIIEKDITDMIRAVDIINLKRKGILPVYDERDEE